MQSTSKCCISLYINLHIGTNKKCSRNQWCMSIERSIIYYERQHLLQKTTDVGNDVDQSHTGKNLNFYHFGYREIESPRNCLEVEKRGT